MKGAIAWFASNGVAANLLMLLILAGGLITLPQIREEVFPEFSTDLLNVTVLYPGAAPEEVEQAVCVRIEEAIQSLTGVKRITSTASESMGIVNVELLKGTDLGEALDEIKARVDAITTFPEQVEEPVIQELIVRNQVINIAVSGRADERTLKSLAERVRDEIASLPGITQVELSAARPYEVSIEISEGALRRYQLSFDQVAQAVRRSSLDLPGGSIRTKGGEILLRAKGQAYLGREFEELVLLSRQDGTRILLGDVATVVDGFAETDQSARFDGEPAVLVQVYRVGGQRALEIAEAVHAYVASAQKRMPEGIRLTTWKDDSRVLKSRLKLLVKNGLYGLVLVVISLTLFLRISLALWVSLGIPISFLGCFLILPYLDVSINLISLFAFIVVLGIVVDDAIVVGENIYSHHEQGEPQLTAAINGAREMLIPIVFAVLTTMAAFGPLLAVEGSTGKIMKVIPLVVIPTLVFSLVESLLILPAHLSHLRRRERKNGIAGLWNRFQGGISGALQGFVRVLYLPVLRWAMEWRYLTVAIGVSSLLLISGVVGAGWVKFTFFPAVEADNVVALLTMPQGTPAEVTAQVLSRIERSAEAVRAEMESPTPDGEKRRVFQHVLTSAGEQPMRVMQNQHGGDGASRFTSPHLGEVNIELVPSEKRSGSSSTEIANRWRELTGPIPDAVELIFSSSLFSTGEPVNVQLSGPYLDRLQAGADELKAHLAQYPGVYDIADSLRAGKQEIKLNIRPAAETLGLTLSDLARQVRQAFYGEEVQRIQRGRDEVKIMVRYPAEQRRSLGNLEKMRIRSPSGQEVPFSTVASSELGRGFATIRRVDRNRSISVTAEIDDTKATANEILADLESSFLPQLAQKYPRLDYSLEGQQRQQRDTIGGLINGFSIAMILIYALLAIPLKSYGQPLIVMAAIPFGLVGAVLGHILMGLNLTILSMFGIVALAGVVVNDSLILVDYVNRQRRAGVALFQAVHQAGGARFRPIFLTSLTTFAGLTPLLMEKSLQAKFLIPMAVSIAFGVAFSTLITLLLVPASYLIMEDVVGLFPRRPGPERSREQPQPAESSPVIPAVAQRLSDI